MFKYYSYARLTDLTIHKQGKINEITFQAALRPSMLEFARDILTDTIPGGLPQLLVDRYEIHNAKIESLSIIANVKEYNKINASFTYEYDQPCIQNIPSGDYLSNYEPSIFYNTHVKFNSEFLSIVSVEMYFKPDMILVVKSREHMPKTGKLEIKLFTPDGKTCTGKIVLDGLSLLREEPPNNKLNEFRSSRFYDYTFTDYEIMV